MYPNVIRYFNLMSSKVLPHQPQPCHLQIRYNFRSFPLAGVALSSRQYHKYPRNPAVETLHHCHHCIYHNPDLTTIKQHHLNYRLVQHSLYFHVRSHLYYNLSYHHPQFHVYGVELALINSEFPQNLSFLHSQIYHLLFRISIFT